MTDQPSTPPAAPKPLPPRRGEAKSNCAMGGYEPRLPDLLDDPLTRQLMASDRIEIGDLSRLIARIRHYLAIRGLADSITVRGRGPAIASAGHLAFNSPRRDNA